jgi:quinol monooxygenase YgiN
MTFVVAATWIAKDGEQDAVANALRQLAGPSRQEAGMILYQPHRDPEDPTVFFLYEQYVDKRAYDEHASSAHFKKHALNDAIPRLESRARSFFEVWEP